MKSNSELMNSIDAIMEDVLSALSEYLRDEKKKRDEKKTMLKCLKHLGKL